MKVSLLELITRDNRGHRTGAPVHQNPDAPVHQKIGREELKGSECVLANLVNHKKRSIHVKNLKIFNYDPEVDIPADTARRDYMEFVVEKVLGHAGDTKKPTTMSFHIKWLNYDDSHNT